MNPFNWIRSKVAQAVVDGFDDGLTVLNIGADTEPAQTVRQRLSPTEPVPAIAESTEEADDEPKATRRKRA